MARRILPYALTLMASGAGMLAGTGAVAQDGHSMVQGVFCNSAEQLDQVLATHDNGFSLQGAVEMSNRETIGCSYIDRLHFVVRNPVRTGTHHGRLATAKFEAVLTGVVIGNVLRPVSPPASIHFVTHEPPPAVMLEQRL
jgi:hypothetical protein